MDEYIEKHLIDILNAAQRWKAILLMLLNDSKIFRMTC